MPLVAFSSAAGCWQKLMPIGYQRRMPLLAAITGASVQGRAATGERAGQRLRCLLANPAEGSRSTPSPRPYGLTPKASAH